MWKNVWTGGYPTDKDDAVISVDITNEKVESHILRANKTGKTVVECVRKEKNNKAHQY